MNKEILSRRLRTDLERLVSGKVADDAASITAVSTDYGGTVVKTPKVVVSPRDASEVAAVVAYAYQHDLPISPRAGSFAFSGQALNEGGVVLDMRGLDAFDILGQSADRCIADAGTLWKDVVGAALTRRRVPPVLTSYLGTSIGGTLSAAGFGNASFRHGTQLDHCLELEVAGHDGELVRCSLDENRDLFELALGGFGQFGVITRAVVRLRPCALRTRTYFLQYVDLETQLADQRRLMTEQRVTFMDGIVRSCLHGARLGERGPERLYSYLYPLTLTVEADDESTIDDQAVLGDLGFSRWVYADDLSMADFLLMGTPAGEPKATTSLAQIFTDVLLPWEEVESFLGKVERHVLPRTVNVEHVRLGAVPRAALTRPMLRVPESEHIMGLGIYTATPRRLADHNLAMAQGFVDLAMKVGATYYLTGAVRLDEARYQRQFGDDWPRVLAGKRQYDPKGLFNPGFFAR
ncbi:MAG: FAD-binding protein [Acidobacteriota bacterium]